MYKSYSMELAGRTLTVDINRKLRDCRFHFCDKLPKGKQDLAEQTSIFITEGDSASGTITKVRKAEIGRAHV